MTVRQLAKELASIKDELQDKEVLIKTDDGRFLPPDMKFVLRDKYCMDKTEENVDFVVL